MTRTILGGLAAFLVATTALADVSDQLKICAGIEDADARLACFDAIGRAGNAQAPGDGAASEKAAPDVATERVEPPAQERMPAPPTPAMPPAVPGSSAAVTTDAEPSVGANTQPGSPGPTPPNPAGEEPATSAPSAVPEDFGMDSMTERERQQLAREKQKAEAAARKQAEREAVEKERSIVVKAQIINVRRHSDGRFSVTLDNGQVWRETQGSRVGVPAKGAMAELKKGKFGGYRMNIDGIYRTAWVKRTK